MNDTEAKHKLATLRDLWEGAFSLELALGMAELDYDPVVAAIATYVWESWTLPEDQE